jgi:hypothetical protein
MIPFTMNILNYKNGVYTVEYLPTAQNLHIPIKLDIQLDPEVLTDKNKIIERLKMASPQEYWYSQSQAAEVDSNLAASLVNTSHDVAHVPTRPTNPVNSFGYHGVPQRPAGPTLEDVEVDTNASTESVSGSNVVGSSSPEEVATPQQQNVIKLKMLIQQVLQEMAEGTV